jgi:hypothetical protein
MVLQQQLLAQLPELQLGQVRQPQGQVQRVREPGQPPEQLPEQALQPQGLLLLERQLVLQIQSQSQSQLELHQPEQSHLLEPKFAQLHQRLVKEFRCLPCLLKLQLEVRR